jgi:hypothetical protein
MIPTKKEFIETSHIGNYGRGRDKYIAIFHDWEDGSYVEDGIKKRYVGYKYMFVFQHLTKKDAINEVYNRIYRLGELNDGTLEIKHIPCKVRVATDDKFRFKVPLSI